MLATLLGEVVLAQRLRKGLSQAQLARNARVSRTVLSRLERGKALAVQTDVLDRLFQALDCKPPLGGGQPDARMLARLELLGKQEQNRSRHLRLAIDLADDERVAAPLIAKARERVELWRERRSCSPRYIELWARVLDLPPRRLAKAMSSFGEWENAMFQNSPWSWVWS